MSKLYQNHIKRLLDITLSGAAIIVLSPVMGVTALLVRKKLGSPVLFKQKRPGKDEKIFTMYKFRTMTDAKDGEGNKITDEERLNKLLKSNGLAEKDMSDSQRLTPFGKKLRAMSLDELPELFNIFIGNMSFVGPRPLAVIYLPYYNDEERLRHSVKPGLTGLAQINGRNSAVWKDRFMHDVEYVKNVSFSNDFKILLKTISVVFFRDGIAQAEEKPEAFNIVRQREWDLEKNDSERILL